ncbi:hypothetical protein NPIL_522411 [Nephila pilipes]|uniref:Uncharacterized protein n=1 Tax=Nephila pilipes TaxID=299642 RepID=A0A8X6QB34_NEPPI|nr:hypothetical protein NPIL_522411 [Nephila pilipes]
MGQLIPKSPKKITFVALYDVIERKCEKRRKNDSTFNTEAGRSFLPTMKKERDETEDYRHVRLRGTTFISKELDSPPSFSRPQKSLKNKKIGPHPPMIKWNRRGEIDYELAINSKRKIPLPDFETFWVFDTAGN